MAATRLNVVFAQGRDVPAWERRHADGLTPDRWPYGLDGLSRYFSRADAREVGRLRPIRLLRALLVRTPSRPRGGEITVSLSWEEDVALRMLEQVPADITMSGVIWATDAATTLPAKLKRYLSRQALRRMDLVWTLSEPQVEIVERWLGTDGPPVRYLRFGVDHEFYAEQPFPTRPMLFSAGGDRDRDPETLFRALAIVRRERPDVEVLVQSRTALRPPDGVQVVPYMTHVQLREAYGRASVVAIATRPNQHASGMTVSLEAMAVGRPVVITDTPGISDYVRNEETGYLVRPGDHRPLARRILALLSDPAGAAAMGRRARCRVLDDFTSFRMAEELAALVKFVRRDG
ncbi:MULTISPECIES: glycosyltransferase family 4 protein [unclassified Curtobacterium]|uniref:glycosyltransferase family 4 protein n=1 Tax=unclassified Curtobacterium TaxID=257496 RepID=UPI0038048A6A